MRVKPPGEIQAPNVGVVEEPSLAGANEVGEARAPTAAEATAPAAAVDGAKALTEAGGVDPVVDVARRLRAGEISGRDALELLIDHVIARQVGRAVGAAADRSALATHLKELLRRHAESDPYLASKVRRLGNRS